MQGLETKYIVEMINKNITGRPFTFSGNKGKKANKKIQKGTKISKAIFFLIFKMSNRFG